MINHTKSSGKTFFVWLWWIQYGEMPPKSEFWRDEFWALNRKNDRFWLPWGISKEYNKQNITMAVLRKANSHSVVIGRLIKKYIKQKKIQGEKLIQTLIFPKLSSVYEALAGRNGTIALSYPLIHWWFWCRISCRLSKKM